jgi:ribonuclease HII
LEPEIITRLCGLDEAGRGPLAGPLVAAAVIFPPEFVFSETFPDLKFGDSKKLSSRQREAAYEAIHEHAVVLKIETVPVEDINKAGIGWANRTAFERLIMEIEADEYIVDGSLKLSNLGKRARRVKCIVDADNTEQAVIAASIVAKVKRDRIMRDFHMDFPIYGWDHNMGYGTHAHITALHEYGPCRYHRRRFVATALAKRGPKLPGFDPKQR